MRASLVCCFLIVFLLNPGVLVHHRRSLALHLTLLVNRCFTRNRSDCNFNSGTFQRDNTETRTKHRPKGDNSGGSDNVLGFRRPSVVSAAS